MLKKIIAFALAFMVCLNIVPLHILAENSSKEKKLDVYAKSALLMDADSGRVLYEENGYNVMPMASTTKIMTCILTLENSNLDEIVKVSKYAAGMPDVQLGIKKDEEYYLRDLVYALMLESSNDAAVAIAEHVSGSVEAFCDEMTAKAKELGAVNTTFKTPNGLDAKGHETTCYDLAIISKYAIENEEFIKITNTVSWTFKEIKSGKEYFVSNKNRFLVLMDGAFGIKTGFTNGAGYCFVGALKRDDKTFISVVLGSGWPPNKNYKWHDTQLLMKYGIENFNKVQLVDKNKLFDKVFVDKGKTDYVDLIQEDKEISVLLKESDQTNIEYDIPSMLTAPIEKNTIVGYAKYYINNQLYCQIPIKANGSIEQIDFKFCLEKILQKWYVK